MPMRELRAIYEVLFRDGVMVAKKDKRPQIKHPEVQDVSNLQVIRAMGSLKSRGYVKETFAWRHFYWYLTNEGIVYVRDYLHLPTEIIPASLQRIRKPAATLAIAHRAARVQSVQGPTSYVPKPGRRGEAESEEALAERQGYRYKTMRPEERDNFSYNIPRFRGRPVTGDQARLKTSFEAESQPLYRRGTSFSRESMTVEENHVRRVPPQESNLRNEKIMVSQERSKEKVASPVPVQASSLKQDASQTTATSSTTVLPLSVAAVGAAAGVAVSKISEISVTAKAVDEKVKPKPVLTVGFAQETCKVPAVSTTPVGAKSVVKDVNDGKLKKEKTNEESIKPTDTKTQASVQSERPAKIFQDGSNPKQESSTRKTVGSTIEAGAVSRVQMNKEPSPAKETSENLTRNPKTDHVPEKMTTVIKTTNGTMTASAPQANADGGKPATGDVPVTQVITQQAKTTAKEIPHVKKDKSELQDKEAPKVSVQGAEIVQEISKSSPSAENTAVIEEMKDTKEEVGGRSKSKRKKKKSPAEKSSGTNAEEPPQSKTEKDEIFKDKGLAENTTQPTPVITSEPITVSTSMKTSEKNNALDSKNIHIKDIAKQTDGKQREDLDKPKTLPTPMEEASVVPLVDVQVKVKPEDGNISKITQGPVCPKGELKGMLPHMEQVKSEKSQTVETMTEQKINQVELLQANAKSEEKPPGPMLESQKPAAETISQISAGKAADESSKGKKKGKKQVKQSPDSETVNTKPVLFPETETLPSTGITIVHKTTAKESPAVASEMTETKVPPKMTPERMCSEEVGQAAAVLSEAPADKGEVEPAQLSAEKIKREVPKPETSSTVREAPAAGELASAVPAEAAEARASLLVKQEEPPIVAQHLAAQAAERSTDEGLSVPEALKQEQEKDRDTEEDTPSATATPGAQLDQPHLSDTCDCEGSDTDEAAMKRKIVVVEEIVEVKQLISPDAAGEQSPPPPVKPEPEEEELDLDVLEELAIERALLAGAGGLIVQGASPEADWDHSLEDPEEKTWPNFVEGLFEFSYFLSCLNFSAHVVQLLMH